uniref:C2H2-type domain-containing protein n=1 Tax=Monopterus albus TaxID=43700 RepID=A0A3Q3IFD8_MONAL|nr:myoneurin-like isoform X2 [Monopterus albus]
MASRVSFHSQLSSIMEAMARSALSQVCELVDEDSAELRLELSRLLFANSALAEKVNSLECELTIVRSDAPKLCKTYRTVGVQTVCYRDEDPYVPGPPTIEGIFGKDWCMKLWKDRDPYSLERITDSPQSSDKSMAALSDQITVTDIKEEDYVEEATSSCQQETIASEEHEENMAKEREQLSVGYSAGGSTCSLSFDQDEEQIVSAGGIEEQSMQLISISGTEEAFSTHIIPIEDDIDDDDVQFIQESQQDSTMNTGVPSQRVSKSCELCGKTFANPSALRIHYVVHTGEKPYRCSLCAKRFTQKGNLKCHLRIHTGERPFHCVKCGKTFTQKVNLNHHLMAHRNREVVGEKRIPRRYLKSLMAGTYQ